VIRKGSLLVSIALSVISAYASQAGAQEISLSNQVWDVEMIRKQGQPVIPLYDGWFQNEDGTKTICFSYFNMNTDESIDIPHGERNYLSAGEYEVLLPTHFDPLPMEYRHVFCAFSVTVPGSFGVNDEIWWHLNTHGEELKVPGKVIPPYIMDEPSSGGRGGLAPLISFSRDGEGARGRRGITLEQVLAARVGQPLELQAWIQHPGEEVWVGWAHHSGPGSVSFDEREYTMVSNQSTSVEVSFSEPGDYVIRLQSIDDIDEFEYYCCHTNAYYKVSVSE
jgi:hypothetical protein